MTSVSVTKTETGWTVTKGSDSWQITDKNKDGRFDSDDLIKGLNGNANSLDNADISEIWWQTCNLGDGVSAKETAIYNAYQQQKEQYDAAQSKKEEQQAATQQPVYTEKPKKGVWGKISSFCQKVLPFLPIGLGVLGAFTAWSRNNRYANDALITMNSITNMMTTTMSTMAAMNAMNNVTRTFSVDGIGANYGNVNISGNAYNEPSVFNLLNANQFNTPANASQKNVAMQQIINQYTAVGSGQYSPANANFLNEMSGMGENQEYTDEQIKKARQIQTTPNIPINYIKTDNNDTENKLEPADATTLNNYINNYKKYDNQGSDLCLKVMTQENFKKLTEIMNRTDGQLSKEDYEFLKKLISDENFRIGKNEG